MQSRQTHEPREPISTQDDIAHAFRMVGIFEHDYKILFLLRVFTFPEITAVLAFFAWEGSSSTEMYGVHCSCYRCLLPLVRTVSLSNFLVSTCTPTLCL
jgi:hypothetical protein